MKNSSGKANDANRAALLRKRNYSLCDETVLLCHGPFNALIPIGKTEISVTEPGHPLIWTHRKSTGLIWRDPKFARPHWISYQKSIPFVCAQISGIATGQTLQLLKKREIIAFFLFFKSESVYYLSRGEVKNAPWTVVLAKQFVKNAMTLYRSFNC